MLRPLYIQTWTWRRVSSSLQLGRLLNGGTRLFRCEAPGPLNP